MEEIEIEIEIEILRECNELTWYVVQGHIDSIQADIIGYKSQLKDVELAIPNSNRTKNTYYQKEYI